MNMKAIFLIGILAFSFLAISFDNVNASNVVVEKNIPIGDGIGADRYNGEGGSRDGWGLWTYHNQERTFFYDPYDQMSWYWGTCPFYDQFFADLSKSGLVYDNTYGSDFKPVGEFVDGCEQWIFNNIGTFDHTYTWKSGFFGQNKQSVRIKLHIIN